MRFALRFACLGVIAVATPAVAMDHYGYGGGGQRMAAADPDAKLERLADAQSIAGASRGKPVKSTRAILRDDPYLRSAFAWLDNK